MGNFFLKLDVFKLTYRKSSNITFRALWRGGIRETGLFKNFWHTKTELHYIFGAWNVTQL